MTLIRQRGPSDCGIAAIAMFAALTYEEVWTAAVARPDDFHPKRGMSSCSRILEALGFHQENLGRHPDYPAPNPDGRQFRTLTLLRWCDGVLHPNVTRQFVWGRPTLLSIVSLNHPPHGRHLVFFDGERVQDPQEGRRGKKYATQLDDVEIKEAWFWQHKGNPK